MEKWPRDYAEVGHPYVSTGHLPTPDLITALVREAHQRFS